MKKQEISQFRETLIPIVHYLKTIGKRELSFDFLLPLIFSIVAFFLSTEITNARIDTINSTIINFNAIMAGFNIAGISIFVTGSNDFVKEIQNFQTDKKIGSSHLSLFRLTFINLTYSLFIQFLTVSLGIFYMLFYYEENNVNLLFFSVIIFFFIHSIFLNFRNASNLYLSIKK